MSSSKQNNTTSLNSSKLASNQYVAGHAVANNLKPAVTAQRTGQQPIFHEYWSAERVSAALEAGAVLKVCMKFEVCLKWLIQGSLRINVRNYEEAFISAPGNAGDADILIYGMRDRNRSLHGDIVAVSIKQRSHWVVRQQAYIAWRRQRDESTQVRAHKWLFTTDAHVFRRPTSCRLHPTKRLPVHLRYQQKRTIVIKCPMCIACLRQAVCRHPTMSRCWQRT
jgi:hypothetical protein